MFDLEWARVKMRMVKLTSFHADFTLTASLAKVSLAKVVANCLI